MAFAIDVWSVTDTYRIPLAVRTPATADAATLGVLAIASTLARPTVQIKG
ncbi:hypothetical protein PanNE5_40950 [Pandoraea sp. NE5]|nr:hypothetical protein PanNE5_40950 [Pandoraea sp. NE5]